MKRREALAYAGVAALALAAGGGTAYFYFGASAPDRTADPLGVTLPDTDGVPRALRQWSGKVVVLNFWATWCEPCREETPLLVGLSGQYESKGVQFVGIAIDRLEPVRRFGQEYRVPYPLLIGGLDTMEWAKGLGNRSGLLPYTVVVGRDGKVAYTKLGAVKKPEFEPIIVGLL